MNANEFDDDTPFIGPEEQAESRERAQKLIKRVREEAMDREHVRSTIESPGWRIFFERTIKPTLDDWRFELLTRLDMPEGERRGMVLARTTLLEGLVECYKKSRAHIPEWFQKELDER